MNPDRGDFAGWVLGDFVLSKDQKTVESFRASYLSQPADPQGRNLPQRTAPEAPDPRLVARAQLTATIGQDSSPTFARTSQLVETETHRDKPVDFGAFNLRAPRPPDMPPEI